ncbi:MAG: hypothetical protein IT450_13465 [Phycisphaerales bacterium]|nr:hypothetical protein [Phycisphaerales bacterium]
MRRRKNRLLIFLNRGGIAICGFVIVVVAVAACFRWKAVAYIPEGGNAIFVLEGGTLEISWADTANYFGLGESRVRFFHYDRSLSVAAGEFLRAFATLPDLQATSKLRTLTIPLWLPLLMIGIPTASCWRRLRRPAPGCCKKCGYDLTGNVSGTCPECGTPLPFCGVHP